MHDDHDSDDEYTRCVIVDELSQSTSSITYIAYRANASLLILTKHSAVLCWVCMPSIIHTFFQQSLGTVCRQCRWSGTGRDSRLNRKSNQNDRSATGMIPDSTVGARNITDPPGVRVPDFTTWTSKAIDQARVWCDSTMQLYSVLPTIDCDHHSQNT